jgi:hypothetical protein
MNGIGRYIHWSVCQAPGLLGPGGIPLSGRFVATNVPFVAIGQVLGDARQMDYAWQCQKLGACSGACVTVAVGSKKSYTPLNGDRNRRRDQARPRCRA